MASGEGTDNKEKDYPSPGSAVSANGPAPAATRAAPAAAKPPIAPKPAAPPSPPFVATPSLPVSMLNAPSDGTKHPLEKAEKQFDGEVAADFESALAQVETLQRKGFVALFSRLLRRAGIRKTARNLVQSQRRVAFDGFRTGLYEEKTERDRRYGTVYNVSEEVNAYLVRLEMPRRVPDSALKKVWNLSDEMPDYDYSITLKDGVLSIRASVPGEAYRRLSYVSSSFPSEFLTRIAFAKPIGLFKHRLRNKVLEIIVFKTSQDEFGRAA